MTRMVVGVNRLRLFTQAVHPGTASKQLCGVSMNSGIPTQVCKHTHTRAHLEHSSQCHHGNSAPEWWSPPCPTLFCGQTASFPSALQCVLVCLYVCLCVFSCHAGKRSTCAALRRESVGDLLVSMQIINSCPSNTTTLLSLSLSLDLSLDLSLSRSLSRPLFFFGSSDAGCHSAGR